MDRLARAVKRAAQLREGSFDSAGFEKAVAEEKRPNREVNKYRFYGLTLLEAANQAAEEAGYDTRGTFPVYILLKYSWNEKTLEWAEQFEEEAR